MEDLGATTPEQHPAVSQPEMTEIQYMTIHDFKKTTELNCLLLTVHLAAQCGASQTWPPSVTAPLSTENEFHQFDGIKIKCKIIYSLKPVSYTLICGSL